MGQEKPEKKKGKFRIFLKWAARVIFGLFLLVLIYFQAPWKLLAFLGGLYLADIFLKQPYLRYFRFAVLAGVLVLAIWVFLPEEYEGWEPVVFKDKIDRFNYAYMPDDANNALAVYKKIFEEYDSEYFNIDFDEEVDDHVSSKPWTAQEYPEAAIWLSDRYDAMERIREAAEIETFYLPIDSNDIYGFSDFTRMFRPISYLFVRQFYLELGNGDIDGAMDELVVIFKISKQLANQPSTIYNLISITPGGLALYRVNDLLVDYELDDEQLGRLKGYLEKYRLDTEKMLEASVEQEKLMSKVFWVSWTYEQKDGKYRFMRSKECGSSCGATVTIKNEYIRERGKRLGAFIKWFFLPNDPEVISTMIEDGWSDIQSGEKLGRFKLNYNYSMRHLAQNVMDGLKGVKRVADKYDTAFDGSLIVLKLREFKNTHGKWPETLDGLGVDGVDLDKYIYKKIDDEDFVLYSIGENGVDDGGYRSRGCMGPSYSGPAVKDDRLIVPRSIEELEKLMEK